MTFLITNPAWKSPVQQKAELHAPAVRAWLYANADKPAVTLGQLRAGLPAIAGDLSRLVVNQICAQEGFVVQGAEDTGA